LSMHSLNSENKNNLIKFEKIQHSFFANYEKLFLEKISLIVPRFIKSSHLTLITILWSLLIIIFSFLAQYNYLWLLASSVVIIFHCLTDALDIEIEKREKNIKKYWNFYIDHILDYFFLIAIIIGYSLVLSSFNGYLLASSLVVSCSFMTNSFLYLAITNRFKIAYFKIGPTEGKFLFIAINLMIILLEERYVIFFIKLLVLFLAVILILIIYKNQHNLLQNRP